MFSGSTVIFTVYLASSASSSFGAALRGASIATVSEPFDFDPASTEARVFAEEVFDPTGAEVQLFDEDSQVFKGFISAQDKVKAIEDEVAKELQQDWAQLEKEKKEKDEMNNNIKEFYQRMMSKILTP